MSVHSTYHVGGTKTPAANETKSLWLLAPASTAALVITELGVSFADSAAKPGVRLELYRVTTIGTPAGTTDTARKVGDVGAPAAATTALINLTAEPTAVELIGGPWEVQPFGGMFVIQYPLGREPQAPYSGARIGLRYVNPTSGTTAEIGHYVIFEE